MYRSFASDREREGISRSLQQTEDWLYDEGDDETENAYILKLEDLHKVIFFLKSGVCLAIFVSVLNFLLLFSWLIQLRVGTRTKMLERKLQETY